MPIERLPAEGRQLWSRRSRSSACSTGLAVSPNRSLIGCPGLEVVAEGAQQFGAGGVEEMIFVEVGGEGVDVGERGRQPPRAVPDFSMSCSRCSRTRLTCCSSTTSVAAGRSHLAAPLPAASLQP
jgi:hypothetical protein